MKSTVINRTFRILALMLCIATIFIVDNAQAAQKMPTEQIPSRDTDIHKLIAKLHDLTDYDQRQETINALADIGAPAVPILIQELERGKGSRTFDGNDYLSSYETISCIEVLRKMSPEVIKNTAVPALRAKLIDGLESEDEFGVLWKSAADVLCALLGEESIPILKEFLGRNSQADYFLVNRLGPDARSAVKGLLENPPTFDWDWRLYYTIAGAKPGKEHVPALLEIMKKDEFAHAGYISMILAGMGPEVVPQISALLGDTDWYARWAAARTFEIMGPSASAALPALEKAFGDDKEDLDVRVAAARAIARIKGTSPFSLYEEIPDMERRLLKATEQKSLAWRETFTKREGARKEHYNSPNNSESYSRWQETAWWVYALTSGKNISKANASILDRIKTGNKLGSYMECNLARLFFMCHSKSSHYPGRLEPEIEEKLKQRYLVRARVQNVDKEDTYLNANDDKALDRYVSNYLGISVLKDDPEYRDKELKIGGTVTQAYQKRSEYYKHVFKQWAWYGLQYQLGSSSYNYHIYNHYFNLIDLSPDPEVRQLARMFMDISLMEIDQISISDVRGGSKGRPKKGGLGDRWNVYRAMVYGERGRTLFHAPLATSRYQAPEPALLLHKLGSPVKTYEIINLRAGELDPAYDGPGKKLVADSRSYNYAYCTPEYVTGCVLYDPNRQYHPGSERAWTGVTFRNRAAIAMSGYVGETWSVQRKDARVTQQRSDEQKNLMVKFPGLLGKVSESDGWIFVDNGDAFAAVKVVRGGYFWRDPVRSSLYVHDRFSPMIIQTGRAEDYGSFDKFKKAILKAPLKFDGKVVTYTGPNSATLEFYCMTPGRRMKGASYTLPKIDGKTIDLNPEYVYYSPYMQRKEDSDIVTLFYGDRKWEYDFEKNAIRERK